jgi:hypothetical protein
VRGALVAIAVGIVAAATACRGRASREECDQMMDHYVDLVIKEDATLASLPPESRAAAREVKRELKRGEPSYRKVAEHCETDVTRAEASCAIDAPTSSSWENCIR